MAASRIKLEKDTQVALVLQGGGALGAYQAGVYEGVCETRIEPTWIAGISIGALNAAIIAGNPAKDRVAKLAEFWGLISKPNWLPPTTLGAEDQLGGMNPHVRSWWDTWEAWRALTEGQRGFFAPRHWLEVSGVLSSGTQPKDLGWYDTTPMLRTLNEMVDFDRINKGEMRVSVGAVNVRTGELEYFDNRNTALRAEHFLASGSLPPSFPAVEIDGEFYWDGGVVSNTPLSYVMQNRERRNMLVMQIDLWNSQGELPETLFDVTERVKEIQYSSRTRNVTQIQRMHQHYNRVIRELLEEIPDSATSGNPWVRHAHEMATDAKTALIHMTYRETAEVGHFKDYQFGRIAINEHIAAGRADIAEVISNPEWFEMPTGHDSFVMRSLHGDLKSEGAP